MGPYKLAAHTRLLVVAGTVASFVVAGLTPVAVQANTTAVVPFMPGGTASSATYLLLKKKKKKKKPKKKSSSKKKKKKSKAKGSKQPSLTPESAESKRQAIRDSVASDKEAENWGAVADGLESNATLLGDPVTMMEAGDARLKQAEKEQSVALAQQSIATTQVALDILYYYDAVSAGAQDSTWLVIDPATASGMISEGDGQISAAEDLISDLESEDEVDEDAAPEVATEKKKKRKKGDPKPGTALIAAGAALTAVGAAGMGVGFAGLGISASKQKEVEGKTIPDDQAEVDKLDDEGRRANILGFVGLGIAAGALAVGIPLIVIGVRKRKKAPSNKASIQVAPMVAGPTNGFSLQGKF